MFDWSDACLRGPESRRDSSRREGRETGLGVLEDRCGFAATLAKLRRGLRRDGPVAAAALAVVFWAGLVTVVAATPSGLFARLSDPARAAGLAGLAAVVTALAAGYIRQFQPTIVTRGVRGPALALFSLAALALVRACVLLGPGPALVPVTVVSAAFAFVLALAYPRRTAVGLAALLNLLIGLCLSDLLLINAEGPSGGPAAPLTPAGLAALVITLSAGGATIVSLLRQVRNRTRIVEVGLLAGLVYGVAAGASFLYLDGTPGDGLASSLIEAAGPAASAFLSASAVGVVLTALLPYVERVFGLSTAISLIELSDANQPLLRRLAEEAPGTFNHSLLLGTICEAAAEEIGADGLLCRVGCYYHDIGKLHKPEYYIENQARGANRHDGLAPSMSRLIIVNHPRLGLDMAREAGLPGCVWQFIESHHGTCVMEYFYDQACKQRKDGDPPVAVEDFRYPGPKPKTREAAIVMLADGIEGAVRSLAEPTPARIADIVRAVAVKRLVDGQFDECDLTLAELHRVETALVRRLSAHYHGRIAYPASATTVQDGSGANLLPGSGLRPVIAAAAAPGTPVDNDSSRNYARLPADRGDRGDRGRSSDSLSTASTRPSIGTTRLPRLPSPMGESA